ncbi:MAG: NDP-sugar synthase, partial [Chroococcales cyanobacterium]
DKTGASIDVQAAALDWLITDTRQAIPVNTPEEGRAIAELLESEGRP